MADEKNEIVDVDVDVDNVVFPDPTSLVTPQEENSFYFVINDLTQFSSGFILASLIDIVKAFVTSVYLAKLGDDHNAAGALISSTQLLLMSISCCSYATGNAVGKVVQVDQVTPDGALSEVVLTSTVFANLLSIPLVVLYSNMGPLLNLMGQDERLSAITNRYYLGYTPGIPAVMMISFLQQYIVGHGAPKDGLIVFAAMFLNTGFVSIFGYLLTFGVGDSPSLGVLGLGLAHSIVSWINLGLLLLFVVFSERYNRSIDIRRSSRAWDNLRKNLMEQIAVGGAITLRVATEVMSLFIATLMVSEMDNQDEELEAEQIANQYMFLLVVPLFGLTQAIIIKAVPSITHQDKEKLNTIAKAGCTIACILTLILDIVIFSASKELISLYINIKQERSTYITARNLLYINATAQIPDALKNIIFGLLNAMDDPYTPLLAGVGVNVLFSLALGYVLGFPAKLNAEGVFIARLLMTILAAVILCNAFVKFDFQKPKKSFGEAFCRFWSKKENSSLQTGLLLDADPDPDQEGDSVLSEKSSIELA